MAHLRSKDYVKVFLIMHASMNQAESPTANTENGLRGHQLKSPSISLSDRFFSLAGAPAPQPNNNNNPPRHVMRWIHTPYGHNGHWYEQYLSWSDPPSLPRRHLNCAHHGRRSAPGTLAARGGAHQRGKNKQKHGDDRFILYKTAILLNDMHERGLVKELIDPHTASNPNPNRGLFVLIHT